MADTESEVNTKRTIIVKKDKKKAKENKLYNLGSKLFVIFHAIAVVYTLLYIIGTFYNYGYFIFKIPSNIKNGVKYLFLKNNEHKYNDYLTAKQRIDQQLEYLNSHLSYYRWKSITHFFTVSLKNGFKAIYNSISIKNIYKILIKNGIYGIPKLLITNILFRINNYYYIALFAHALGTLTLLHFQKFQQRTLRVFSAMSNYDAMSVNYLQVLMLNAIAFFSTPAFLKLVPFMAVSLASVLNGKPDLQKKINALIPSAFICSLIPYFIRTLALSGGEGFFCCLYTLVIVVKCKFNKYDNLVILKIVAFIDKIVNKKFAKKEGEEVDFKLAKWNSIKRSIIADTVML
ncbi:hypothetical protein D499_0T00640 [Hanseniaspora uvarum DSM 2768]|nr:hypothetical protein D499_0T00640 [Hanseniaspora uvarum DSM 2768]GMM43292.1 hypothetical protein DAHU10_042020 [Hanseniaspora uvarum]